MPERLDYRSGGYLRALDQRMAHSRARAALRHGHADQIGQVVVALRRVAWDALDRPPEPAGIEAHDTAVALAARALLGRGAALLDQADHLTVRIPQHSAVAGGRIGMK